MFQDYWFHVISFLNIVDRYTHKFICTDAQNMSTLLGWKELSEQLFNDPNAIDAFIRADWTFFQHQTKCHFRHNVMYYYHLRVIFWTPVFRYNPLYVYQYRYKTLIRIPVFTKPELCTTQYDKDWCEFGNWARRYMPIYEISTNIFLVSDTIPKHGSMHFKVGMAIHKNLKIIETKYITHIVE